MKKIIIGIILTITVCCAYGQTSIADCKGIEYGIYAVGSPEDSVYVMRNPRDWSEYDMKKGVRYMFDIIWESPCEFSLVYNFKDGRHVENPEYHIGDTLKYAVKEVNKSKVVCEVINKGKETEQVLWQTEVDTARIEKFLTGMISDSSALKKFSELYPDSLKKMMMGLIRKSGDNMLLKPEWEVIETVLSYYEAGDITPLYNSASDVFKMAITSDDMNGYNRFIQAAYGKLKNYSVSSTESGMGNSDKEIKCILNCRFEKANCNVKVSFALKKSDSVYQLSGLNVVADSVEQLPFIKSLGSSFFESTNSEKFKKIYEESADTLKAMAKYNQISRLLSVIYEQGNFDGYKAEYLNYSPNKSGGYFTVVYKMVKGSNKSYLSLSYIFEQGEYKLAGLHYDQK